MGGTAGGMSEDYLLYDGECPACSSYVAFSRLRRLHPSLKVLDARENAGMVEDLRRRGYEINEGMVMQLDGRIFFGAEATRQIARHAQEGGVLRGAVLNAIGDAPWSRALYPVLNACRRLLLRALGRTLIQ
jgi:predicted DCC family thiol-disulfide oxidoreductase YuxK